MNKTLAVVSDLKDLDQDYEWYPTTQHMIDVVKKDMLKYFSDWDYDKETEKKIYRLSKTKVLDCGAGDGRVAKQLANGGTAHIQASEELNIRVEETEKFFKANFHLAQGNGLVQIGWDEKDTDLIEELPINQEAAAA